MNIYSNNFFVLKADSNNDLYVSCREKGFDMKNLAEILEKEPRVLIKQILQFRKAIDEATGEDVKVGITLDRIQVFLSKDKMKAEIKLNIKNDELQLNKLAIVSEIVQELKKYEIKEGIITELFSSGLEVGKKLVIAKGIDPVDGNDAKAHYFQISDRKPVIREDDRADYYDLQFIDQVKAGDWLGEKIFATEGKPGKTVTGESIPGKKGKDVVLRFDRKTIVAIEEKDKVTLRAGVDGAIKFQNGTIMVENHLVINGDVNTATGNIEFDGSITITGTVNDGFSVTATNDISVLSEIGIGKIAKIISKKGDIFIKGGVSGKGIAELEAGKNIFVKYANECTLKAVESINIGLYSLGSNLFSKKIILDENKGRIVGGTIKAEVQVISAVIGNESGRKTSISVEGFDRNTIMIELNRLLSDYKLKLDQTDSIKREIEVYESAHGKFDEVAMREYIQNLERYDRFVVEIFKLEQRRQELMNYLETKGEGQVSISKKAYPQTMLRIKAFQKKLEKITTGTFYAVGKELHFE